MTLFSMFLRKVCYRLLTLNIILTRKVIEKPAPPRAAKIRQLLGDDAPERYIEFANDDSKPWYLRAEYNKDELVVNPDGGIRAGTLPALVERLTTHDYGGMDFL